MYRLILFLFFTGILSNSYGQFLDEQQRSFIKKYNQPIEVNDSFGNGNWNPVLKEIGSKKIVLLGEFNHGSREVFLLKNDLIKALHEKKGFDVILFESGIGEMESIDLNKANLSSAQMTEGFFGIWRTAEFRELMSYIQENKISISGFDVQRSGGTFEQLLSSSKLSSSFISECIMLEKKYGTLQRKLSNRQAKYDSLNTETTKLISDYNFQLTQMEGDANTTEVLFIRQTLMNRMHFLSYMLEFLNTKDWNKRWAARDSAMAANIRWLSTIIYPDKKIIVLGHNYHIAKYNEKEQVMGEYLSPYYGKDMYALGIFARDGSFKGNSGSVEKMLPADSTQLDIKHVIREIPNLPSFISLSAHQKLGDDWLTKPIVINDTFIDLSGSNQLILSKHFDGLLLLDSISPSEE